MRTPGIISSPPSFLMPLWPRRITVSCGKAGTKIVLKMLRLRSPKLMKARGHNKSIRQSKTHSSKNTAWTTRLKCKSFSMQLGHPKRYGFQIDGNAAVSLEFDTNIETVYQYHKEILRSTSRFYYFFIQTSACRS